MEKTVESAKHEVNVNHLKNTREHQFNTRDLPHVFIENYIIINTLATHQLFNFQI